MRHTLLVRILACTGLLLTLLSVSGADFALAASGEPRPANSCCHPLDRGNEPSVPPCSVPECPSLFCLHLSFSSYSEVAAPPPIIACSYSATPSHRPAEFIRPIEYPPENS
jgi:hypothetical protein